MEKYRYIGGTKGLTVVNYDEQGRHTPSLIGFSIFLASDHCLAPQFSSMLGISRVNTRVITLAWSTAPWSEITPVELSHSTSTVASKLRVPRGADKTHRFPVRTPSPLPQKAAHRPVRALSPSNFARPTPNRRVLDPPLFPLTTLSFHPSALRIARVPGTLGSFYGVPF